MQYYSLNRQNKKLVAPTHTPDNQRICNEDETIAEDEAEVSWQSKQVVKLCVSFKPCHCWFEAVKATVKQLSKLKIDKKGDHRKPEPSLWEEVDPLRKDWVFQHDLLPVVGHEENIRRKEARKTDQGKNEDQNLVKLVSVARHDHVHDKLKSANARN